MVLLVVPAVDGGDHAVGHAGLVLEVVEVVLHRAEERQDRLVDADRGQAAVEVAPHLLQVLFHAFAADRLAQRRALVLQQALVGLQVEQAAVVAAVVVLGLRG